MKILVTGGGGFLGKAIAQALAVRGDSIVSFSRNTHPELEGLGIEHIQGDLAHREHVMLAAQGCQIIIHTAAKTGVWGSYDEYHRTNVIGTENIIETCRKLKISRLIYTSSPSVVFDGSDMEGADESVPYPAHYDTHYPATKAHAERLVLASNSASLATIALRPHLIWGPGDTNLIPRIIQRGRSGHLRIIGNGRNRVDSIYIDNAVHAHLLAVDRLAPGAIISGKAYFITNDEPIPLWELVNQILETADIPPVTRHIPAKLARWVGWITEMTYHLLRKSEEPMMTRFLAKELSTAHWFDISAAKCELGYQPQVTIHEGLDRLKHWLHNERTH